MTEFSTSMSTSAIRRFSAGGYTALERFFDKDPNNRYADNSGAEEWVRTAHFPASQLAGLATHLQHGVDNLLFGTNPGDVYAPCINDSIVRDDPKNANGKVATVIYKRPPKALILRPGRALLSSDGYSTTVTEEMAEFRDTRLINANHVKPGEIVMGWTTWIEVRQQLVIKDRGTIIVEQADDVKDELVIYKRREDWLSKGGKFTVGGRASSYPALPQGWGDNRGEPTVGGLLFENLKLVKCQIERRASDLSIVDSLWTFAQKPEGWAMSGVIPKSWFCCSNEDGTLFTYDDEHEEVHDEHGRLVTRGGYLLQRLNVYDNEVINGEADFTPIQEYFKWMT